MLGSLCFYVYMCVYVQMLQHIIQYLVFPFYIYIYLCWTHFSLSYNRLSIDSHNILMPMKKYIFNPKTYYYYTKCIYLMIGIIGGKETTKKCFIWYKLVGFNSLLCQNAKTFAHHVIMNIWFAASGYCPSKYSRASVRV